MPDQVSEIGVRLTLDATSFDNGLVSSTTALNAFQQQAAQASAGAAGFHAGSGSGKTSVGKGGAATGTPVGVDVTLNVTPQAIASLRKRIISELGAIPVTLNPQMPKTGPGSAQSIIGTVFSAQYGLSPAHGRQLAKQALDIYTPKATPRAMGGPVSPGRDYLVGERRPEIVRFAEKGRILPDAERVYREREQQARAAAEAERRHLERMNKLQYSSDYIKLVERRTAAAQPPAAEPTGFMSRLRRRMGRDGGGPVYGQPMRPKHRMSGGWSDEWIAREKKFAEQESRDPGSTTGGGAYGRWKATAQRQFLDESDWLDEYHRYYGPDSSETDRANAPDFAPTQESIRRRAEEAARFREREQARREGEQARHEGRPGSTDTRSREDKMRAMATQTTQSPNEAEAARAWLRKKGVKGYMSGGSVRRHTKLNVAPEGESFGGPPTKGPARPPRACPNCHLLNWSTREGPRMECSACGTSLRRLPFPKVRGGGGHVGACRAGCIAPGRHGGGPVHAMAGARVRWTNGPMGFFGEDFTKAELDAMFGEGRRPHWSEISDRFHAHGFDAGSPTRTTDAERNYMWSDWHQEYEADHPRPDINTDGAGWVAWHETYRKDIETKGPMGREARERGQAVREARYAEEARRREEEMRREREAREQEHRQREQEARRQREERAREQERARDEQRRREEQRQREERYRRQSGAGGGYGGSWGGSYGRSTSGSGSSTGTRTDWARGDPNSPFNQRLIAMAGQTTQSPNEAEIARTKLRERGVPGYFRGGFAFAAKGLTDVEARLSTRQRNYTGNLRSAARDLTPEQIQAGRDWYPDAQKWLHKQSLRYGIPETVVRGMGAALSASTEWSGNKTKLLTMLDAIQPGMPYKAPYLRTFNPHAKAEDILRDYLERGETQPFDKYLKHTPKTSQFYLNMGGDLDALTVDRWAFRTATQGKISEYGKGPLRTKVEASYRKVAKEVGLQPAEFQAAVWVQEKEEAAAKAARVRAAKKAAKRKKAGGGWIMEGLRQASDWLKDPMMIQMGLGQQQHRMSGGKVKPFCALCGTNIQNPATHQGTAKHRAKLRGHEYERGSGKWLKGRNMSAVSLNAKAMDEYYDELGEQERNAFSATMFDDFEPLHGQEAMPVDVLAQLSDDIYAIESGGKAGLAIRGKEGDPYGTTNMDDLQHRRRMVAGKPEWISVTTDSAGSKRLLERQHLKEAAGKEFMARLAAEAKAARAKMEADLKARDAASQPTEAQMAEMSAEDITPWVEPDSGGPDWTDPEVIAKAAEAAGAPRPKSPKVVTKAGTTQEFTREEMRAFVAADPDMPDEPVQGQPWSELPPLTDAQRARLEELKRSKSVDDAEIREYARLLRLEAAEQGNAHRAKNAETQARNQEIIQDIKDKVAARDAAGLPGGSIPYYPPPPEQTGEEIAREALEATRRRVAADREAPPVPKRQSGLGAMSDAELRDAIKTIGNDPTFGPLRKTYEEELARRGGGAPSVPQHEAPIVAAHEDIVRRAAARPPEPDVTPPPPPAAPPSSIPGWLSTPRRGSRAEEPDIEKVLGMKVPWLKREDGGGVIHLGPGQGAFADSSMDKAPKWARTEIMDTLSDLAAEFNQTVFARLGKPDDPQFAPAKWGKDEDWSGMVAAYSTPGQITINPKGLDQDVLAAARFADIASIMSGQGRTSVDPGTVGGMATHEFGHGLMYSIGMPAIEFIEKHLAEIQKDFVSQYGMTNIAGGRSVWAQGGDPKARTLPYAEPWAELFAAAKRYQQDPFGIIDFIHNTPLHSQHIGSMDIKRTLEAEHQAKLAANAPDIPGSFKKAGGGRADGGVYIVGEIGDELFVPERLAHMVPDSVMTQIPHAASGMQVIGQRRNELFFPPEDGVIIPHRLMDQVPRAQDGSDFRDRFLAGSFTPSGPLVAANQGPIHRAWSVDPVERITKIIRAETRASIPVVEDMARRNAGPIVGPPGRRAFVGPPAPPGEAFTHDHRRNVAASGPSGMTVARFGRENEEFALGLRRALQAVEAFTDPVNRATMGLNNLRANLAEAARGAAAARAGVASRTAAGGFGAGAGAGPGGSFAGGPGGPGGPVPPWGARGWTPGGGTPPPGAPAWAGGAPPGGGMPPPWGLPKFGTMARLQMSETERIRAIERMGEVTPRDDVLEEARRQRAGRLQSVIARTPRVVSSALGAVGLGGAGGFQRAQVDAELALERYRSVHQDVITSSEEVTKAQRNLDDLPRHFPAGPDRDDARAELTEHLTTVTDAHTKAMGNQVTAANELVDAEKKAKPGFRGILRNFGAITLAVGVYGVAMQAANAIIEPAIQGLIKASQAFGDEQMGFGATSQRVSKTVGEAAVQMGGNVEAALAQASGAGGLGAAGFAAAQQYLTSGVTAKGGGVAAQQGSDVRRAIMGAINGAPEGLYGGYGGLFGGALLGSELGGGKGAVEIKTKDLRLMRGLSERTVLNPDYDRIAEDKKRFTTAPGSSPEPEAGAAPIPPIVVPHPDNQKYADLFASTYMDYNEASTRYTSSLNKANAGTKLAVAAGDDQVTEMVTTAQTQKDLGLVTSDYMDRVNDLAAAHLVLLDANGKLVDSEKVATEFWDNVAGGEMLPTMEEFAAQQKRAIQAAQERDRLASEHQLGVAIPGALGLQLAAQPFIPARAGVLPTSGAKGLGDISVNGLNVGGLLKTAQKTQDDLTKSAKKGLDALVDWVGTQPGMDQPFTDTFTGTEYKTGKDAMVAFTKSLTDSGTTIAGWQEKIAGAQSNMQWAQYRNNLRLATRAHADALGLAGQGGGSGGVMGRLERAMTLLGFQLSQKQINFQVAMAGFQAPGVTSEQRAANQAMARMEADVAQRQLNNQKAQFAESAQRGVTDTGQSVTLLKQEQATQTAIAAAQKAIASEELKMSQTQQKIQTIMGRAEGSFNSALSAGAGYATQFGQSVKDATKTVYEALGYTVTYDKSGTMKLTKPQGGGDLSGQGGGNKEGFLGSFAKGAMMTVGEAGPETVAILRNPTTTMFGGGGGGGGPTTVNLYLTVQGDVKDDATIAKIQRAVEDAMNRKAARLGMRSFASSSN